MLETRRETSDSRVGICTCWLASVALVVMVGVLFGLVGPVGAEEVRWVAPVDAPVVDPFRPPASSYSAGNRGLEYGLNEVTDVRAVDDGRVSFAGRVGTNLFVSVDHGNGLTSTLAYLSSMSVVRGQFVSVGEVVATAGAGFHLTARLDGIYIDPALLIAGVDIGVALVSGPAGPSGARAPDRAVGEARIGRGRFDSALAVINSAEALIPSSLLSATAEAAAAWHNRECSEVKGGVAVSPTGEAVDLNPSQHTDRVLIQVGGLGSHSESASIGSLDPLQLGYRPSDVKGFSYAGGCIARPFGLDQPGLELTDHAPSSYGPEDTYQDINESAARLADVVEHAAAARPGATIDVAAHSLGGVVTRRATELLAERGRSDLLGVVMTIGSPHAGADLATIASAAHGGLDLVDQLSPEIAEFRDAESVIQLSEVGSNAIGPAPPPPQGPTVVAVAGSTDLIVPAPEAIWDGATNVLVSLDNPIGAHSDLPGARAVHDAFVLAQAGAAPPCISLAQATAGVAASTIVHSAEDAATIAAGVANWLL
ncbi:MAG: peptidoglycan DD-metalloendopeptidase family protein [Acidimicrobiales bacterium]